ncbi:MAG: penicillin-binding protein activator, partial [Desulfobacterales bacterium]|nr:penicillin-binding protein activator [Desulfobacterales bacterium]
MKLFIKFLIILTLFCSCSPKTLVVTPESETLDPSNELLINAEKLFEQKAYDDSLSKYNEYLSTYPDKPSVPLALFRSGSIYAIKNDYTKAKEIYKKLYSDYPQNSYATDARYETLNILFTEKKYEELISNAKNVLSIPMPSKSYKVKIYQIMAEAYMNKGDALNSAKSYMWAYETAEKQDKAKIALKLKTSTTKLNPSDVSSLFLERVKDQDLQKYLMYELGKRYISEQNFAVAIKLLTSFAEKFPQDEKIEEVKFLIEDLKKRLDYDRLLIGVVLPLSGSYSKYGNKALKGIQFALYQFAKEFPDNKIKLIIKDTESDNAKNVQCVKELSETKALGIIGPLSNAENATAEAKSKGIPIITLTQKENMPLGDYIFRNFLTPKMQIKTIVGYVTSKLSLKRFVILYPAESYGNTFMKLFRDEVTAMGGTIIGAEAYKPHETDFANIIKKIEAMYPFDAIFIPAPPKSAGLIIPQLAYYKLTDTQLIGTNVWHSDALIQLAKDYAQGAIMPDIFFAKSESEKVKKFVSEFEASFNEKPEAIEAISYDTAMIFFKLISTPNVKTRENLKNELINLKDFEGVTGLTSFDQTGEAIKKLFILKIE